MRSLGIIVFKTRVRESVTRSLVPGGDSRKLHRKKTLDRSHWTPRCQNNWGTWRMSPGLCSQKLGGQREDAGLAGIMRGRELAVRSTYYAPGILVHLLLNLFFFPAGMIKAFLGFRQGWARTTPGSRACTPGQFRSSGQGWELRASSVGQGSGWAPHNRSNHGREGLSGCL